MIPCHDRRCCLDARTITSSTSIPPMVPPSSIHCLHAMTLLDLVNTWCGGWCCHALFPSICALYVVSTTATMIYLLWCGVSISDTGVIPPVRCSNALSAESGPEFLVEAIAALGSAYSPSS